jgi:PPM family protein phosphatase
MILEEAGKKSSTTTGFGGSVDDPTVPAAITDAGCERELNEDRYAVIECPSGLAWLVCDGMGGVAGGELAAQLALDAIRRDLENAPPRAADEALRSAILEANRIIVLRRQNQAFAQMGTTVVAILFAHPEVVLGHAGDSRAYLVRGGAIQQLTTDHTYVQSLVDKGQIKQDEALSHPDAHILTRCIGSEPGLVVDLQRYWIWPSPEGEPDDSILLCTDGLYSHVSDGEMAVAVSQNTPQRACVSLVETAKVRGGFDNITLAVIPLGGQLKETPPPGYVEGAQLKRALKKQAQAARATGPSRSLGRDFAILLMLGGLATLLTAVVFFVLVSQ